ncbi:hypothetical protein FRC14_002115 [Serendipita sp. 396]|nr:hypothetical protein FRC14_002115 [Serendipita sp. 396]
MCLAARVQMMREPQERQIKITGLQQDSSSLPFEPLLVHIPICTRRLGSTTTTTHRGSASEPSLKFTSDLEFGIRLVGHLAVHNQHVAGIFGKLMAIISGYPTEFGVIILQATIVGHVFYPTAGLSPDRGSVR